MFCKKVAAGVIVYAAILVNVFEAFIEWLNIILTLRDIILQELIIDENRVAACFWRVATQKDMMTSTSLLNPTPSINFLISLHNLFGLRWTSLFQAFLPNLFLGFRNEPHHFRSHAVLKLRVELREWRKVGHLKPIKIPQNQLYNRIICFLRLKIYSYLIETVGELINCFFTFPVKALRVSVVTDAAMICLLLGSIDERVTFILEKLCKALRK